MEGTAVVAFGHTTIGRRTFLGVLAVELLEAHRSAHAEVPGKVARVGWLRTGVGKSLGAPFERAFLEGLRGHGYVVGQNTHLETRAPESGKFEQFPKLAAELVAANVDVIFAAGRPALEAVRHATKTVPIVTVDLESDPVATGWVASLARPGGNLTGFFLDLPEMSGKQLQLLREVKPDLTRVAVLGDARVSEPQFRATEAAARSVRLALQSLVVTTLDEIPAAIGRAAGRRVGALLVLTSPLIFSGLPRITEVAVEHQLPTSSPFVPVFAEVGGLIAYGPDFPDLYRRGGGYVGRILKGAKPGELPVQRPEKFELAVNLETARALKLTLPQSLLSRADRVIGK
jgi:putative tryptophan/tyrosine transport system substrate-binding protein